VKILITGGAGFIGSNLSRRLLNERYEVTILDNFNPQVHGDNKSLPSDLAGHVSFILGDIRDKVAFSQALDGQEVIVHLAAETGTGQSMYEVEHYEDVNMKGTAILMDYLVNNQKSKVKKIIIASSRAVYGEGKYYCPTHEVVYPFIRGRDDIKGGNFEPLCPICDSHCKFLPSDEESKLAPTSFYGLTKMMQEKMVLLFAKTLNISAFALRYQNVYGPGQSLRNPYTGILSIFANQAKINKPIYIFEDGEESRDFVYIDDAIEATSRCISPEHTGIEVLNVGSGEGTSVKKVAQEIINFFNSNSEILITKELRLGDVRHNVADLTKIRRLLGYEPKWKFIDGIREFLLWAKPQEETTSKYEQSLEEMRSKKLIVTG